MNSQIEQILILQHRDQKLKALRAELRMLPIERKQIEDRLERDRSGLHALKERQKALEVERKALELDVRAKQDSIGKFRAQQSQTRRNEEFQALASEIQRYERLIVETEDRELEMMEQAELLRKEVAAAEAVFASAQKTSAAALAAAEAKGKAIEEQLAGLDAERKNAAESVDPDLLVRYERLFASKHDAAVVPIEHDVCMGCHMKITAQAVVKAKGGLEIVSCPQCGRLIYSEE